MQQMSDVERLLEIEEIKQLKSRRDRAVDTKDWTTLESLHAADHHSHVDGFPPWSTAAEMVANIRASLEDVISVHHSHTPDITFESSIKAHGTWAMEDNLYWKQGDEDHWLRGFGNIRKTRRALAVHLAPSPAFEGPYFAQCSVPTEPGLRC